MKNVYIGMSADIIHHGHINIIREASRYGTITIGLLTDDAIISYKRVPIVTFENRKKVVEYIKNVDKVIPQTTLDYTENLMKLKPDYVLHGDDWREGSQKETRQKIIDLLKQWDGELVEVPYTSDISTTNIINKIKDN